MGGYLIKRMISMFITFLLIIIITFSLMHAVPGGPFTAEKKLPESIEKALEEKYHLNDPLWKQFVDYLAGVATFDLGPSFAHEGQTVNDLIEDGFPVSAKLGSIVVVVVLLVGVPLGIVAALKQNRWQDYSVMFLATLGVTIPNFVLSTLLIYVLALKLGWFPTFGIKSWQGFILPAIALGGFSLSFVSRLTRSSMLEVLQQDYIRTARAKGLPELVVIFKHALRNALIPVVTYVGPLIAAILTGSFVVERIFAIPGMGRHFVLSIGNRDYTVIMGITIFFSVFLMGMILVVDLTYGLIDPRIKIDE